MGVDINSLLLRLKHSARLIDLGLCCRRRIDCRENKRGRSVKVNLILKLFSSVKFTPLHSPRIVKIKTSRRGRSRQLVVTASYVTTDRQTDKHTWLARCGNLSVHTREYKKCPEKICWSEISCMHDTCTRICHQHISPELARDNVDKPEIIGEWRHWSNSYSVGARVSKIDESEGSIYIRTNRNH